MSGIGGDIPGVDVIRFDAGIARLHVQIEEGDPPAASPDVERVWAEMAAANPRLFNGPVLSVVSIDAARGVIRARRDTYQRLVVQPRVDTGVRQLSVTGVVIKRNDEDPGAESVFLGRRGPQTRMYAGQWELGPAGGVDPPLRSVRAIDHDALVAELRRECREEAGLEIAGPGEPLAAVYDSFAQSYDLVLRVAPVAPGPGTARPGHGWEYQETRWISSGELRAFERDHESEIIPPTRALLRALWP